MVDTRETSADDELLNVMVKGILNGPSYQFDNSDTADAMRDCRCILAAMRIAGYRIEKELTHG